MSLGRATAVVGGFTALSRLAGFVRDLLIAAALGAGPVADAFFVSLKLANFLRRLFAEGAFAAAFVPLYARRRAESGARAAARFAGEAMAGLALLLLVVVLLGEWLMPWLVRLLATGFAPGSPRYLLAVELGRITFPYLLLISLAALFASLLQADRRFAAAAFAPVLLNLVLGGMLLATGAEGEAAAHLLAWGLLAAGALQLAWVAAAAWRAGLAPPLRPPALSPEVRRLGRLLGPGLLAMGVVQINILVASWFATHLAPGTVSYLFYADRLIQLPLGVVGVALGTALLPLLVGHGSERSPEVLNRALEFALLLGLPAAVGLGLLARPIVTVLFERGAFGPAASLATAEVLAGLALGLPAQVLARVLAPGFFAREDTATPVGVAGAALAVNLAASLVLVPVLGHVGLALALSLAAWANALGLAWLLLRAGHLVPDRLLRRRCLALLAALLVLVLVLAAAGGLLAEPDPVRLAAVIAAGAAAFLLAAWLGGAVDPAWWRRAARA